MSSNFNQDAVFEKETTRYIRENHILETLGIKDPEFISERELQKKGVDVVGEFNGEMCYFDIKAIGKQLATFSQEIINSKSRNVGWICNNDLMTTHYIYAYFTVRDAKSYYHAKEIIYTYGISAIEGVEIIVVEKKLIQEEIKDCLNIDCNEETANRLCDAVQQLNRNLDLTNVKDTLRYITTGGKEKRALRYIKKGESHPSMYITLSNKIYEKPINCIIRKTLLQEMSVAQGSFPWEVA